jgi:DNA-binding NarL/FixJ family response regulator
MIKVAIIDDNPAIIYGVQAAVEKNPEMELVFTSSLAEDFLHQLEKVEVDILVVDIVLEDGISLNFLDLLRKKHPNKKIIAYSNAKGESIELFLNRIGINELIDKKEPMDVLIGSIIENAKTGNNQTFKTNKNSLILSEREMEIIVLLGKGFSSQEIAEHLMISHNTVNFHKKKLLKKFQVDSITQLIRDAVELGICRD